MTFTDIMRRAVAKIPVCRTCLERPCRCHEIRQTLAEQLALQLGDHPQANGRRARRAAR